MGKDGAEVGEVRVGAWRGEGAGLGERGEWGGGLRAPPMEQLWNNYGTTMEQLMEQPMEQPPLLGKRTL